MTKMENAAGNASAEMEKIYDSLEYKLNAFKETWVGVAQTLLDSDGLKGAVDLLNTLSNGLATVIETLGFFGTTAVTVFGVQFAKSVGRPKMTGFKTVPTYALVVTRNELTA